MNLHRNLSREILWTMLLKVNSTKRENAAARTCRRRRVMRRGREKEETERGRSKFTNKTIHSSNYKQVGIWRMSEQSDQYISPKSWESRLTNCACLQPFIHLTCVFFLLCLLLRNMSDLGWWTNNWWEQHWISQHCKVECGWFTN